MAEEPSYEELLARLNALERENQAEKHKQGYQLGASDVEELDELIQRALRAGNPDALRQFMAIRHAYEIHGVVAYEQLKLMKEAYASVSS